MERDATQGFAVDEEFRIIAPAMVFPGRDDDVTQAYSRAHDLLARRFPVEALDVLEPALAQEPDNTGLLGLRAWAHLIRAQLGRAEADLRVLVGANPADDWAQHALGRALERQNRLTEALPHLRLAAVMSDDFDHHAAVLRVERALAHR